MSELKNKGADILDGLTDEEIMKLAKEGQRKYRERNKERITASRNRMWARKALQMMKEGE